MPFQLIAKPSKPFIIFRHRENLSLVADVIAADNKLILTNLNDLINVGL